MIRQNIIIWPGKEPEKPAEAAAMGARAREKCLREYSAVVAKARLKEIVRRVAGGG